MTCSFIFAILLAKFDRSQQSQVQNCVEYEFIQSIPVKQELKFVTDEKVRLAVREG